MKTFYENLVRPTLIALLIGGITIGCDAPVPVEPAIPAVTPTPTPVPTPTPATTPDGYTGTVEDCELTPNNVPKNEVTSIACPYYGDTLSGFGDYSAVEYIAVGGGRLQEIDLSGNPNLVELFISGAYFFTEDQLAYRYIISCFNAIDFQ